MYAVNLDEDLVRNAMLLVRDTTVAGFRWSSEAGNWLDEEPRATHRIRARLPALPKGPASIELETGTRGRLCCPVQFQFVETVVQTPLAVQGICQLISTVLSLVEEIMAFPVISHQG